MTSHVIQAPQSRRLLTRILELPNLAGEVQSLEPKILDQLIWHCDLEDSAEIIAPATTEQLMRVFDNDLWRSDMAGGEEQFDADRFGLWLEVAVEMVAFVTAGPIE